MGKYLGSHLMPCLVLVFLGGLTASALLQADALNSDNSEAPRFTITGRNGPISLQDFRGKTVYLDFWASWCGPCRKSFPWMSQMQQRYGARDFIVIAINLDKDKSLAEGFLQQYSNNFIIGFDPDGITPRAYQVEGMPSAVLIDAEGVIVSRHIGFNTSRQLDYERAITAALPPQSASMEKLQ